MQTFGRSFYFSLQPKLTEFSWTDCGQPTDLVVFSSLSLQPDPLTFPTTLNISVDATVKEDLLAPITVRPFISMPAFFSFFLFHPNKHHQAW